MEPSIFARIVNAELPCHKVYENDTVLAFLNIYPSQPGHVLVIPKVQVDHLWDLSDADYQAVMAAAKTIALRQREVLGAQRVGVKVVGVDVPHAHVHLIPFNTVAEFQAEGDTDTEPDHQALAKMAQKLSA